MSAKKALRKAAKETGLPKKGWKRRNLPLSEGGGKEFTHRSGIVARVDLKGKVTVQYPAIA